MFVHNNPLPKRIYEYFPLQPTKFVNRIPTFLSCLAFDFVLVGMDFSRNLEPEKNRYFTYVLHRDALLALYNILNHNQYMLFSVKLKQTFVFIIVNTSRLG